MGAKEYWELFRPINAFMSIVGVIIGHILSGKIEPLPLFLACVAVVLFVGGGNSLNDYLDREIDKKAHPERPIPSGRISAEKAYLFSKVLFASSVAFQIALTFYKPLSAAVYFPALALMLGYEFKMKKIGPVGNFVIGLLVGFTFLYGGTSSSLSILAVMLFFYATLANWSREIVKDLQDYEADKIGERKTLPMILGEKLTKKIAMIPLSVAIITSPLPFFMRAMGLPEFAILVFGDLVLIYSLILNWKENYEKSQKVMKLGMNVILIAYVIQGIANLHLL